MFIYNLTTEPGINISRRFNSNTFHIVVRSCKIAYVNLITPEGKKYIAPHPVKASIMTEVFQQLAAGTFNKEQIWKMARRSRLKTSKNNFWVAIRNPIYCGKIFISPYKEEAGYFVKGAHEVIIPETLFEQAQQSLDGRKKCCTKG